MKYGGTPTQKVTMTVIGTPLVAGAVDVSLTVSDALKDQAKWNNVVKNHPYSDPDPKRLPSPDPNFSANSPLEEGDILTPLERLLDGLFSLEYYGIIIMLLLLFLFTYGYVQKYTSEIFHNFVIKHIPSKFIPGYTKFMNIILAYNTKTRNLSIIFFIIILFLIHLLSFYISYKLKTDIADFVKVHNYLKEIDKSSILLMISYRNTNILNIINKYTLDSISLKKIKNIKKNNYQFYKLLKIKKIVNRAVKMLFIRKLFAWVSFDTHQRLNVKQSSTPYRSNINNINYTRQNLYDNKHIFYLWLLGLTDAVGTFQIENKNENIFLFFKLSLPAYNIKLLYFIKKQLGVGMVKKEAKTDICSYTIRDRNKLKDVIFPIFDRYPLLTHKYFDYLNFKETYSKLENNYDTKFQQVKKRSDLVNKVTSVGLISPAWKIVNYEVLNTAEAEKVMHKAWLIGFIEAKGLFFLDENDQGKIHHTFEINQIMPYIVYLAIGRILGIRIKFINPIFKLVTQNSRAIANIIKYFRNNLKGFKSFQYRVWARTNIKHKGDYLKLSEIRNKLLFKE